MDEAVFLLEEIRDFESEKYDIETELKEELDRIVVKKYRGDFSTFMKKEVLNENYGSLRFEIERIYKLNV